MELIVSKRFQKHAKKIGQNKQGLKKKINECLIDFSTKGKKSDFYRKSLKGKWYGYEELQVGGDIRVIVRIHPEEQKVVLEDIGTHSQLNL